MTFGRSIHLNITWTKGFVHGSVPVPVFIGIIIVNLHLFNLCIRPDLQKSDLVEIEVIKIKLLDRRKVNTQAPVYSELNYSNLTS